MKWYVSIKHEDSNFFKSATPGMYLSGIATDYDGCSCPAFMPADPIAYPRRSAAFLARELRRAGYNVHRRPFFFYKLKLRRCSK